VHANVLRIRLWLEPRMTCLHDQAALCPVAVGVGVNVAVAVGVGVKVAVAVAALIWILAISAGLLIS